MKQEEKARAYDEAKERMRAFLKEWENCGAYGEAMEKARSVFPELRESEDERIRKKLIEIIGYFRSRGIDQQLCEKFLTYLEKQEQSEVDLEEEINRFWDSCIKHKNERGGNVIWSNKIEVEVLARHFFELGLNAIKED